MPDRRTFLASLFAPLAKKADPPKSVLIAKLPTQEEWERASRGFQPSPLLYYPQGAPSGLAFKIAQRQAAERAARLRECPPWRSQSH